MIQTGGAAKPPNPRSEIDTALHWAAAALTQGRADDAERLAREVLTRIAQHPRALYVLGCALLLRDRPRDALAPLEKAARAGQDPAVETQLAIALRRLGRTDDALARLARATKRRPAHAEAFHEHGFLLFSLQRYDEAVATLQHGLQQMPATAPDVVPLLIQLGAVHHTQRDRSKARAAFARALELAPEHPGALFNMGAVLLEDAEFGLAAEHLQRALAGNPKDVQCRLKLGICLLELGRSEEALEYLRSALRSDPKFYGTVLRLVSSAGHGRFWTRPSMARKMLT
jgi:tetratricopeptide (TPR) repeat protein